MPHDLRRGHLEGPGELPDVFLTGEELARQSGNGLGVSVAGLPCDALLDETTVGARLLSREAEAGSFCGVGGGGTFSGPAPTRAPGARLLPLASPWPKCWRLCLLTKSIDSRNLLAIQPSV
jgi:hypothetical protein